MSACPFQFCASWICLVVASDRYSRCCNVEMWNKKKVWRTTRECTQAMWKFDRQTIWEPSPCHMCHPWRLRSRQARPCLLECFWSSARHGWYHQLLQRLKVEEEIKKRTSLMKKEDKPVTAAISDSSSQPSSTSPVVFSLIIVDELVLTSMNAKNISRSGADMPARQDVSECKGKMQEQRTSENQTCSNSLILTASWSRNSWNAASHLLTSACATLTLGANDCITCSTAAVRCAMMESRRAVASLVSAASIDTRFDTGTCMVWLNAIRASTWATWLQRSEWEENDVREKVRQTCRQY